MKCIKIENTQNISKIMMRPWTIFKCQSGQDWFKNDWEIEFIPDKFYPDYMDIVKYIQTELDGSEMNIEDMLQSLYIFLFVEYKPKYIKITDTVVESKTHFSVTVIKEGSSIN